MKNYTVLYMYIICCGHILQGPYTILWHSLAECQVLFKVDLKQTAIARKIDTMKTLIAKGALNEDVRVR